MTQTIRKRDYARLPLSENALSPTTESGLEEEEASTDKLVSVTQLREEGSEPILTEEQLLRQLVTRLKADENLDFDRLSTEGVDMV